MLLCLVCHLVVRTIPHAGASLIVVQPISSEAHTTTTAPSTWAVSTAVAGSTAPAAASAAAPATSAVAIAVVTVATAITTTTGARAKPVARRTDSDRRGLEVAPSTHGEAGTIARVAPAVGLLAQDPCPILSPPMQIVVEHIPMPSQLLMRVVEPCPASKRSAAVFTSSGGMYQGGKSSLRSSLRASTALAWTADARLAWSLSSSSSWARCWTASCRMSCDRTCGRLTSCGCPCAGPQGLAGASPETSSPSGGDASTRAARRSSSWPPRRAPRSAPVSGQRGVGVGEREGAANLDARGAMRPNCGRVCM
eukprot:7384437-Prymnesium_polylepis.3